jgi:hypothetical protein
MGSVMDEQAIIDYCKTLTRGNLIAMWQRVLDAYADLHALQTGDCVMVDCDAVSSDPYWGREYHKLLLDNWVRGRKCWILGINAEGLYQVDYHQGSFICLPRIFLDYQFTPEKVSIT